MSIQSEIMRIKTLVTDSYDAVVEKGGSKGTGKLANLPSAIRAISGGGQNPLNLKLSVRSNFTTKSEFKFFYVAIEKNTATGSISITPTTITPTSGLTIDVWTLPFYPMGFYQTSTIKYNFYLINRFGSDSDINIVIINEKSLKTIENVGEFNCLQLFYLNPIAPSAYTSTRTYNAELYNTKIGGATGGDSILT